MLCTGMVNSVEILYKNFLFCIEISIHPKKGGPHPLIVFAHGWTAPPDDYSYLLGNLAQVNQVFSYEVVFLIRDVLLFKLGYVVASHNGCQSTDEYPNDAENALHDQMAV